MKIIPRLLGLTDYEETFAAMKAFTAKRSADCRDELWLTQHYPVFTQGKAGKAEHLINQGNIPLVQSDRGGQLTYHGPGQIVLYALVDIKRAGIGVRQIVTILENGIIDVLNGLGIEAQSDPFAPGVYVNGDKIASLGLRVKRGCTYHGVALNVDMDLGPFSQINPCGYKGLNITQISAFSDDYDFIELERELSDAVIRRLMRFYSN